MKVSSLLYERVLLEAGNMSIQAGPHGSFASRHPTTPDRPAGWQTPKGRKRGQDAPISVAIARETTPGVPAPGPYHQVVHSETSICWLPSLEPFQTETEAYDWIVFGYPSQMAPEFAKLEDKWKRRDDANGALERLVPVGFVRSQLVKDISRDLAVGASGGWDVSVDRYHGRVIGARFASDATLQTKGFALPILVPRVGDLEWSDIVKIRKLKAIQRLRDVLREVEIEAFEVARSGGDLEAAMHAAYVKKVAHASGEVHGLRSAGTMGVAELLVGAGAGYATTGLTLLGPLAGAGVAAIVMTGWHVRRVVRERRQRAWIGVMDAISAAGPEVTTGQPSPVPLCLALRPFRGGYRCATPPLTSSGPSQNAFRTPPLCRRRRTACLQAR
jgi:hypothetical protein